MDYLNVKGRIFDIQRFSVHDGPGIRTIVFLKGCKLRCRWCCNPESQSYEIETMITGGKEKVMGRDVTVKEILDEVLRDRIYYRRSGGGLTLSGGEFLCQPDFSEALLRAAKESGINTAVETTSCAPYETIERMLPYIDYYLMDVKHTNSAKHKEFTGVPNELMLANARRLVHDANNFIVRVPVIPGFNDTESEIADISKFAASIGARQLHLLPYHRLGKDKYEGLGREYLMGDAPLHTKEHIELLRSVADRSGIKVEISRTDTFVLKVSPPVRPSGNVEGSEKIVIVGPKGSVYLKEGVIIANRHIHLTPDYAAKQGIKDNDYVDVEVDGIKPTKFFDVQVRVRDDFNVEMHIDTDDANAAGIRNGDRVKILKK